MATSQRSIKYAAQHDQSSCAPLAILNALKALGLHVTTAKNLRAIKRYAGWKKGHGTDLDGITAALAAYSNIYAWRFDNVTIRQIDDHLTGVALTGPGPIVMNMSCKCKCPSCSNRQTHAFTIVSRQKQEHGIFYEVVNYIEYGDNHRLIPRAELVQGMRQCWKKMGEPQAWMIKKRGFRW
jgi:hypothetical protein